MELKLDTSKTYAIALEGGGARGAYQIGAWKALEEAGVRYNAVSGSSVGALNGALMAMRDLPRAEEIWSNITFSQVMDVDDDLLKHLFDGKASLGELRDLAKYAVDAIRDGGIDVTPLRRFIAEVVDGEAIRASDVAFYAVTYSITDRKELDLDMKTLPTEEMQDMLLASAYFPVFKHEKLGGKLFTDGGVQDVVPIHSLISRGYKDLLVLRIYGVGIEKRVKIPKDVQITTIAPNRNLGSVLNFDKEQSRENMTLGYFDAKRVLYGLEGERYYFARTMTEEEAYTVLAGAVRAAEKKPLTLRALNEKALPALERKLGEKKGDYYAVLAAWMEDLATKKDIEPFCIRTDRELLAEVYPTMV